MTPRPSRVLAGLPGGAAGTVGGTFHRAAVASGEGVAACQAESLLKNVQERFQTMSDQLTQRMDEMGSNIEELQKNVSDLMTQAGMENTDDTAH
ncbi:heat shock factor-binding protein 1-like protein 1 [Dendropsophus ebraccatus]|uniref:heat shock factor-binding protein 1-like protein 1 n=1 Tax=Dendropsophus ebraccatus TaxID=150705 RepID=UPI003831F464